MAKMIIKSAEVRDTESTFCQNVAIAETLMIKAAKISQRWMQGYRARGIG